MCKGDFPGDSDGKASAYNAGDPGSIPGLGRSPGGGNGNPLQYSCRLYGKMMPFQIRGLNIPSPQILRNLCTYKGEI